MKSQQNTLYTHRVQKVYGSDESKTRNLISANQINLCKLPNENIPISYIPCINNDRKEIYHSDHTGNVLRSSGDVLRHSRYRNTSLLKDNTNKLSHSTSQIFHRSTPVLREFPVSCNQEGNLIRSTGETMLYPKSSNPKSFTSTYKTLVRQQQQNGSTYQNSPAISTVCEPINVQVGMNFNSVTNKYDVSHIFSQIARINDHLYLSSLMAITPERLQQYGITLVVSAIGDKLPPQVKAPGVSNLHIIIEDVETSNLRAHFDRVADRIFAEYRRGGRALVHCMAGVSRSSSLCLAYLMKHHNMSLAKAYQTVKSARSCIQPNRGFWKQLLDYEQYLYGKQTVNLIQPNFPHQNLSGRTRHYERPVQNNHSTYIPIVKRPSVSTGRRPLVFSTCLSDDEGYRNPRISGYYEKY